MSDLATNAIIKELGTLTERIDQNHRLVMHELAEVKQKQDHTNGNVTELQSWRREQEIAAAAVKKYKKENPVINRADTVNIQRPVFTTKAGQQVLLAVAGLITAIGVAITAVLAGAN